MTVQNTSHVTHILMSGYSDVFFKEYSRPSLSSCHSGFSRHDKRYAPDSCITTNHPKLRNKGPTPPEAAWQSPDQPAEHGLIAGVPRGKRRLKTILLPRHPAKVLKKKRGEYRCHQREKHLRPLQNEPCPWVWSQEHHCRPQKHQNQTQQTKIRNQSVSLSHAIIAARHTNPLSGMSDISDHICTPTRH